MATGAARLVGLAVPYTGSWPSAAAVGLAAAFAIASSAHFLRPRRDGLIAIVPPWIPHRALVVTATGVLEIAGAAALLIEPLRTLAAICLALLLLAIFPANVRAATGTRHSAAPTTPLGPRLIMQLGFLTACIIAAL